MREDSRQVERGANLFNRLDRTAPRRGNDWKQIVNGCWRNLTMLRSAS